MTTTTTTPRPCNNILHPPLSAHLCTAPLGPRPITSPLCAPPLVLLQSTSACQLTPNTHSGAGARAECVNKSADTVQIPTWRLRTAQQSWWNFGTFLLPFFGAAVTFADVKCAVRSRRNEWGRTHGDIRLFPFIDEVTAVRRS